MRACALAQDRRHKSPSPTRDGRADTGSFSAVNTEFTSHPSSHRTVYPMKQNTMLNGKRAQQPYSLPSCVLRRVWCGWCCSCAVDVFLLCVLESHMFLPTRCHAPAAVVNRSRVGATEIAHPRLPLQSSSIRRARVGATSEGDSDAAGRLMGRRR